MFCSWCSLYALGARQVLGTKQDSGTKSDSGTKQDRGVKKSLTRSGNPYGELRWVREGRMPKKYGASM